MAGTKGMRGVGRKREPSHLRLLKSPDGKHDSSWRKIEAAPPFNRYCPVKPDDLTTEASLHWDEITPEMLRLQLLTQHNIGSLVIMCETWARWKMTQRKWEEDGCPLNEGSRRHPYIGILESSANQYRSFASEFGMTPSSETRLGSKPSEQGGKNPFAEGSASS